MRKSEKVENRGGKRDGAGRKPLTVSASQIRSMQEAAAQVEKKTGRSLWKVCLDWIYDTNLTIPQRQTAWKMFTDKYVIRADEGGEADRIAVPAVFLPEQHPRLKVVDGGKED